jgi:hypothetical protein
MKKSCLFIGILFSSVILFSQTQDSTLKNTTSSEESLGINFGAGLIRNTITPLLQISLNYTNKDSWGVSLNTASYFFFEQTLKVDNTKDFSMYINTFLNAEFLFRGFFDNSKNNTKNWNGIGIGSLIGRRGDYFTGTTAKLYYIFEYEHITITTELIFTNNFKTVFPGISIVF